MSLHRVVWKKVREFLAPTHRPLGVRPRERSKQGIEEQEKRQEHRDALREYKDEVVTKVRELEPAPRRKPGMTLNYEGHVYRSYPDDFQVTIHGADRSHKANVFVDEDNRLIWEVAPDAGIKFLQHFGMELPVLPGERHSVQFTKGEIDGIGLIKGLQGHPVLQVAAYANEKARRPKQHQTTMSLITLHKPKPEKPKRK